MVSKKLVIHLAIIGSFAVLVLAGCEAMQSGAPPVTPAMTRAATVRGDSEHSLVAGRRLLATRCISCHGLEPIASRSAPEWSVVVANMAPRAGLSPREAEQVQAYLVAARESISE